MARKLKITIELTEKQVDTFRFMIRDALEMYADYSPERGYEFPDDPHAQTYEEFEGVAKIIRAAIEAAPQPSTRGRTR